MIDEPPARWLTARGDIPLDRPVVAGILNITPDSFSDGGRYLAPDAALRHAASLIEQGADLLDLGAESTRPGRPDPVPAHEEWRRLEPVLSGLVRAWPDVPLSVDTVKQVTARRALEAGAWMINDVSGLRLDPAVAEACAAHQAGLILMHSRGAFEQMATYEHAVYADVVEEVFAELDEAVGRAMERGVDRSRLVIDPGLGFAKRPEQNLALLGGLERLVSGGLPVMVGPSRKRFLGELTGGRPPIERDAATAAACVVAWERGARLFRVHNVALVREALDVAAAIGRSARPPARRSAAPPEDDRPDRLDRPDRPVGRGEGR